MKSLAVSVPALADRSLTEDDRKPETDNDFISLSQALVSSAFKHVQNNMTSVMSGH